MITEQVKSDIMYVCALIEHVGRLTHNRNRDIAEMLNLEGIEWQLEHAQTSHCLTLDETAEEVIEEYKIPQGDFDSVGNCTNKVPLPIHVARTYKSLVVNIAENIDKPLAEIIYDVFTSFISDEISNFNTSTFYENPSYIYHSYLEGELLD